ncbi:MAG: 50S ribosomal protein L9 [Patescibacteria group bacterium]
MKVILLQDVAKVGRRFDVATVPDGHALNKLIPQGIAKPATPENLKQVEARKEKMSSEAAEQDALFAAALEAVDGKEVSLALEANENGHLYEAVKEEAIMAALKEQGATVTAAQIHIKSPIKEVGTHEIELHSGESRGSVSLVVTTS